MSANEREHAREWFDKADTDLTSATLLAGIQGPPETICFLAQQGAEKYLKGYLAWRGVPFRKVHDLLEILNACRGEDDAFGHLETAWGYPRYPFDCTREDASDALVRAEHIRDFVRERLENH